MAKNKKEEKKVREREEEIPVFNDMLSHEGTLEFPECLIHLLFNLIGPEKEAPSPHNNKIPGISNLWTLKSFSANGINPPIRRQRLAE